VSVALLAAQPKNDFPLTDETVSPGMLGFAVFILLCVAVFLLLRSMNKQMGKIQVPREADLEQEEEQSSAASAAKSKGEKAAGKDGERPKD